MNVKLIDQKEIRNFPSGSALEFFDDRLYVVGDDAKQVLILTKRWKELGRIPMFEHPDARIPKDEKADLEASALVRKGDVPTLLLLGSGSLAQHRNKCFLVNVQDESMEEINLQVFYDRIRHEGIPELNIEAASVVNEYMIFCNRGNLTHRENHFIITKQEFWKNQEQVELIVLPFDLDLPGEEVVGVSGLTFSIKNDWLIFTASTEITDSAYKDGDIGESYIGIIENASRKIGRKKMKVNHLMPLSAVNKAFREKKIESVCIQKDKSSKLKLHLVADNDTGITYLFKIRLKV